MVLTDKQLQAWLKSPPFKKEYKREGQGFTVRRMPTGSITFLHIYTLNGKRKEFILGHYPQTNLQDARKRHRKNLSDLDAGIDPQNAPPASLTVGLLAQMYLEQYCIQNKKAETTKENKRILEKYVLSAMGSRDASSVRRQDAVLLIDSLADKTPGTARGVLKTARAMYTWAVDREYVDLNPFSGVSRSVAAVKPVHRDRVLSDQEIKTIWHILTSPKQDKKSESTRKALLITLITGQRPGEVSGITAGELIAGEDKPFCLTCNNCGWWSIPASRSKNAKSHTVYLTPLAKKIMGEAFVFDAGDAIFPNNKNNAIGVSALSHFVAKSQEITSKCSKWTPHDLRRTCATGLSRLGCPDEVIDAILNHTKTGVIKVYNRNKYEEEKRLWLQKWSDCLQELVAI